MTDDHDHGYECCGCDDHPVGKPWGWNSAAWDEHWQQQHADDGAADDPDDLAHAVAHLDPTWAPRCPTCGAKPETLEAAAAVTQVRGTTHLADQLREAAVMPRSCPNPQKPAYNRFTANRIAARRTNRRGELLRAYHCQCGWWHLTSKET